MDTRKLGLILILGGTGVVLLALFWFIAAYAGAMEMASDFGGNDYVGQMLSCLYSSSPICQGASMFSEGPAYSPVVFWIGVIAVLAGIVVRFATGKRAVAASPASGIGEAATVAGEIMGFIPPDQYARYSYILVLSGAVAGLILAPLAVIGLTGIVLAVLGLTLFRSRLNALDVRHLAFICLVSAAAIALMLVTRGTFLLLPTVLAQIAGFYVGFNSYRHGRTVTAQNLKGEFLMALKPRAPS